MNINDRSIIFLFVGDIFLLDIVTHFIVEHIFNFICDGWCCFLFIGEKCLLEREVYSHIIQSCIVPVGRNLRGRVQLGLRNGDVIIATHHIEIAIRIVVLLGKFNFCWFILGLLIFSLFTWISVGLVYTSCEINFPVPFSVVVSFLGLPRPPCLTLLQHACRYVHGGCHCRGYRSPSFVSGSWSEDRVLG